MNEAAAVREIATRVKNAGGRALLVGGCVRDGMMDDRAMDGPARRLVADTGTDCLARKLGNDVGTDGPARRLGGNDGRGKPRAPEAGGVVDYDIEVFGIEGERLREILEGAFELDLVGASFGIIKIKHLNVDVALPRRETKLGLGHKGFAMEHDPSLSVREAAARRDFTINAMYRDPLTDEVIDPWGGQADLKARVLRHVSPHFVEDPLRVLRGMQFVARFDLTPAEETIAVCRTMTPEGLPPERLFGEWEKLLTRGVKISKGLEFLRAVGWTKYYPELEALIGCEQDPTWHPEGDVWNHTMCCLDAFAGQRNGASGGPEGTTTGGSGAPEPRPMDGEDLIVGLAVLCHDFGKPKCTAYDPVKKRIRSRGHDEEGVAPTLSFLRRLTNEERILKEVPPLVKLHMRPFSMWKDKSSDGAIRRLSAQVVRIDRLLRVAAADDAGRPPFPTQPEHLEWLAAQAERLRVADAAPKPIVQGRDLIARGMKPGRHFGEILKACYEAQLDGVFADIEGGIGFAREKFDILPRA